MLMSQKENQLDMYLLVEVYNPTFVKKKKKLNLNLIEPLDLTTNLPEIQRTENMLNITTRKQF